MARRRADGEAARALPDELFDAMLAWYGEMGRDLPWRRTRAPYPVLVSEIMLQQTRVETVLGRWESFLARFPTIADLAAAPLDDVLAEWSGLGYYRRPRALHALARVVTEEHGGEIPGTLDELLALPGLGPYTAAAVGSIAFGLPALSVDGNVGRILSRIAAVEDDFRRAPVRRRLEALAADALEHHDPGELNQAIMELGARICTPRAPRCHECPAASWCEAHALGIEELIPPSNKETVHAVTEHAAVIEHDGRWLLLRGQRPSLVADMWEFPTLDSRLDAGSPPPSSADSAASSPPPASSHSAAAPPPPSKAALRDYLEALGFPVHIGAELGEIRHGMTNRRISCRVYEASLRHHDAHVAEPDPGAPEHGWFTPDQILALPLAASARKTLTELLETPLTPT